jgi:cytochrome c551/c552
MDVSKKYKGVKNYSFKGKEYPLLEGLMMKVSQGGSGNWGTVAMIAIDPDNKKQDQIKKLVQFELDLAK